MPTVTAIDTEGGAITLGDVSATISYRYPLGALDEILRTAYPTDAIESRVRSWATLSSTRRLNYVCDLGDDSYVHPEFNDDWIRANYDASFRQCQANCELCSATVRSTREKYEEKYGQGRKDRAKFWGRFTKLWENLAIAHTAAVFMKEVHFDSAKNEFTNAAHLIAFAS